MGTVIFAILAFVKRGVSKVSNSKSLGKYVKFPSLLRYMCEMRDRNAVLRAQGRLWFFPVRKSPILSVLLFGGCQ